MFLAAVVDVALRVYHFVLACGNIKQRSLFFKLASVVLHCISFFHYFYETNDDLAYQSKIFDQILNKNLKFLISCASMRGKGVYSINLR